MHSERLLLCRHEKVDYIDYSSHVCIGRPVILDVQVCIRSNYTLRDTFLSNVCKTACENYLIPFCKSTTASPLR